MTGKLLVLLFTLSCGNYAVAKEPQNPDCELIKPPYEKVIPLVGDRGRTYWSQTFEYPEGSKKFYLTSTEVQGAGGDDTMVDLQTGQIRPGGKYGEDPFPTPDGRLLTHPGLSIYAMADVMEKGVKAKPKWTLGDNGQYQSIGIVKKEGKEIDSPRVYRTLVWKSLEYFDMRVTFKPGTQNPASVKQVGPINIACENVLKQVDSVTPMLSKKDGTLISIGSTNEGTKVYELDPKTGKCTEKFNLGRKTSKANFSFDDQYIGFIEPKKSASPTDAHVYNRATLVELKTRKEYDLVPTLLSNEVVGYPTFFSDGRVLVQVDRVNSAGRTTRDLVIISIEKLKAWYVQRDQRETFIKGKIEKLLTECREETQNSLNDLTKAWENTCQSTLAAKNKPLELLASLNPSECQSLIDKYWKSRPTNSAGGKLREEDLFGLCPTHALASAKTGLGASFLPKPLPTSGLQVYQQNCLGCHGPQSPGGLIPIGDAKAMKIVKDGKTWIQRVRERTSNSGPGRMPPTIEQALNDYELKLLNNHLGNL